MAPPDCLGEAHHGARPASADRRMKTGAVGRSGLKVSQLGLGCNNFGIRLDCGSSAAVVHAALDRGVTLFDTAPNYGGGLAETYLGEALGARRRDIVLATKFGQSPAASDRPADASRRNLVLSVERSLRALGTDWIDLLQLHWPDPETPMEETLRGLDDLVRAGKILHAGVSNMPAWQVVDAGWTARTRHLAPLISCQDEYSLLARGIERELIPAMQAGGLGLLVYSPLASGLLTGKYRAGRPPPSEGRLAAAGMFTDKFLTEANLRRAAGLEARAREHGLELIEFAFRWLASRPAVSSILAAAMNPEQLAANVRALDGPLPAGLASGAEEIA